MKHTFKNVTYNKATETIRQMPQNYLIAQKTNGTEWMCVSDLAADPEVCVITFKLLLKFENKYSSGESLADKVNHEVKESRKVFSQMGGLSCPKCTGQLTSLGFSGTGTMYKCANKACKRSWIISEEKDIE